MTAVIPEAAQLDEIDRAELLPSKSTPADVVNIGSPVRYRDQRTGRLSGMRWSGSTMDIRSC